MKLMIIFLVAVLLTCSGAGCTDAKKASFRALGKKHHVRLYSGGKLIGEWTASGSVQNENSSDGYGFNDAATGRRVSVSGTVIVETE